MKAILSDSYAMKLISNMDNKDKEIAELQAEINQLGDRLVSLPDNQHEERVEIRKKMLDKLKRQNDLINEKIKN